MTDKDKKVWNEVPGYEGIYRASIYGQIRSQLKILKPYIRKDGYAKYQLVKDGIREDVYGHRIVISAFHGCSKKQVNHIDGNRQNNRIENLEYVSSRENATHRRRKAKKLTGATKVSHGWQATISVNGKHKSLGSYKTEKEASDAYKTALKKHGLENKYAR